MRTIATLLLWMLAAAMPAAANDSGQSAPQPFVAKYAVSYRGINAGTITFKLERDPATGQYRYETQANPSGLARLFVSTAASERSVMEIGPDGVRPLQWQLEDGKSGNEKDGVLRFDWSRNIVSGEVERERVELPTVPGLQDRSSIQISVATALLRGQEPGTIPLIDDSRIKQYTYTKKESAAIETRLGKLDTVVYESTRAGSNRVSRFWMVPELEYLPARAEQIRKGKVETVMTLMELKQDATSR